MIKELEPHACIGVWQVETQWLKAETREIQAGYKKQLFPHEDKQTVEEVIQRGCEGLIARGFQESPGKRLAQPGLVSQVTLLGAGGWTRGLSTSLPT